MEKRILGLYQAFRPPPEAKTYYPTPHEFKDPIRYIHSIRDEAEKEGVIKIVPPRGAFNHKCVINPDTYVIDTRFQKLCGIDMLCRDRMYFIKKLELFWSNFEVHFTWPYINDCYVDMKRLYELVQAQNGHSQVTKAHGWADIARTLGFLAYHGTNLREIYLKWLLPLKENFLDLEKSAESEDIILVDPKEENKPEVKTEFEQKKVEIIDISDEKDDEPPAKRLRKGRMMAGVRCRNTTANPEFAFKINGKCAHCMKIIDDHDFDNAECFECGQEFHSKCVAIKSEKLPSKWRCLQCLKKELKEYEFYFVDNESKRTLAQFKTKADNFKKNYFKVSNHEEVLIENVETEYWKNVADFEGRIEVEYGADLESKKLGSGFPRSKDEFRGADADRKYQWARHPWNLNNLPVLEDSALSHVGTDISGMVVPWVYVGMCFSTFCWHVEDHWTYSMNYMHQGEAKVWYGFGREHADKFEEVMKTISPDLFNQNPSMLNTMHNMLNPLILMEHGIPVKTVRQNAGEFVVTFPRAYHAGFNCGLNVAEAVNFAPYDWLSVGRQCIENYMKTSRCCVFAHDELIFNLANTTRNLSLGMLAAVYNELEQIYERECRFRRDLGANNINRSEFCEFGNVPDDDRSCTICGTTLFVTALEYRPKELKKPQFGCSKHWRTLTKRHGTHDMVVRYSLTLQQIRNMKEAIVDKVHKGNDWRKQVNTALASGLSPRDAEAFMNSFHRQKLPSCEEKDRLLAAINSHSELVDTATRLLAPKIKLRDETRIQRADSRISPQGILELVRKFKGNNIFDTSMIERLDNRYRDYVKWTRRVSQVTCRERELSSFEFVQSLEKLLTEADVLNMKLDESDDLRARIKDANWKIRAGSLVDSHARCQARSLLIKAQSDVIFEEELEAVDMAELDELRAYAKGNWSKKQNLFVETLLGNLDGMRREAVEKLSQVNDFLTASSSKNPPKSRGFAEVFKFASEQVGCIDWLGENLMLEFKEELKLLEEANSHFRKLASGQPMKLASIYHLMRQMDKNRLLINPTELDELEVFRDNSLKFIEEIHNAIAKEGTYHSAVQCLLPRKDLVTMIEEASEKLYKQSRDNFSEEWPELKNVLSAADVQTMFPTYDYNESIRLLQAARHKNSELPTYKTCIDSPGCSKKLSDEEKEPTIECFVCLQKQHTCCAIWSTALDRYPEGLYICHRCCRSQRPTIELIEKLVREGPKESLEVEFVRMAAEDIRNQWEETLKKDIEHDGDQKPLLYALTLELHDPQAFEALIGRIKPSFTEAQKSAWRKVKENDPEMPLTTSGIKDSLLGGKRRRFKCLRIRPSLGSPIKRKGTAPDRCAAGNCLKYKADSYHELQCTSCQNWFHLACVGIRFEEAKLFPAYRCIPCMQAKPQISGNQMPILEPQNELIILE